MPVGNLKVNAAYAEYEATSLQRVGRKREIIVVAVLVIIILVLVVLVMVIIMVMERELRSSPVFATIVRKQVIVKRNVLRKRRMRLMVKRLLWQHQVMVMRRQK
jgi:predicted PurR-regulated permease PerM